MSTQIVILSPHDETRTNKAVKRFLDRAAGLELSHPALEVLEEHPDLDALYALLDEEDAGELEQRIAATQSVVIIENEKKLSADPVFVECLRFLFRRCGDALIQFPEGVAEVEIGIELFGDLTGLEGFDEREEARKLHERLAQTKYRLLVQLWKTGETRWKPRALTNTEMDQFEKSARLSLPPEFRGYLAIVGVGPGPTATGIVPFDELPRPKTHAKSGKRGKLGKTILLGHVDSENHHVLVCDGDYAGTIWLVSFGKPGEEPIEEDFLAYIENWIGAGEVAPLLCSGCEVEMQIEDLEREFCQGCGTRREATTERSAASLAFEDLAKGLLLGLLDAELLEIEEPAFVVPLIAALSEYMSEKGHKWKSPDRAAASIAGWLMHRDEVAELHGSNSDLAKVFVAVGKS